MKWIEVVEELEIKLLRVTRRRIAGSSYKDDEDTVINEDTTDSDGDVDMEGFLAATAPKTNRLILNLQKAGESVVDREHSRYPTEIIETQKRLLQKAPVASESMY